MTPIGSDELNFLDSIFWAGQQAIWLVDLDDTLVRTADLHKRGSQAMLRDLKAEVSADQAIAIHTRFNEIFSLLQSVHQRRQGSRTSLGADAEADSLRRRVEGAQKEIAARWNVTKKFSRELLLYLAAQDVGAQLTSRTLTACVDEYWRAFLIEPMFFEGASEFMAALNAVARVYITTSSDARFTLEPHGLFSYDPDRSRQSKQLRLDALRDAGLQYRAAFIGDPVDKPSMEFFDATLQEIRIDAEASFGAEPMVIALGDSYEADLRTPLETHMANRGLLFIDAQDKIQRLAPDVLSFGSFVLLNEIARSAPDRRTGVPVADEDADN